jgi:hypothetical protein
MPAQTNFTDALSGLFQNPLFLLGANLAALSGKHPFGTALGGAVSQTGTDLLTLQKQASLEQAKAEELGLRKHYYETLRSAAETERTEKETRAKAYADLKQALAGIPGLDPTYRELLLYQLASGGSLSGLLGGGQKPPTAYQEWRRETYEAETERKEAERGRKQELKQAQIERIRARTDLTDQEKEDQIFAIEMDRAPPKPLDPLERMTRERIKQAQGGGGAPGVAAPGAAVSGEAPAPSGGGVMDWFGGAMGAVRDFFTPGASNPFGFAPAPATPLAPPSGDILAGLEAAIPTMSAEARGAAKAQLQRMLADPAMAGMRARIEALLKQL